MMVNSKNHHPQTICRQESQGEIHFQHIQPEEDLRLLEDQVEFNNF